MRPIKSLKGAVKKTIKRNRVLGELHRKKKDHRTSRRICRNHGLLFQSDFPIREVKTSDTLFVMGSGESVNDYTEEQWQQIRAGDSLGLNFWHLHAFIPRMYCYELLPGKHQDRYECFMHNHGLMTKDLRAPYLIGKGNLEPLREDPLAQEEDLYFFDPVMGPRSLIQGQGWLERLGLLSPTDRIKQTFQWKSSVTFAIHLGLIMGYEKIVLCGFDLNNTNYFYESPDFRRTHLRHPDFRLPKSLETGTVHSTNDPERTGYTASYIIHYINDNILKKKGVSLYAGSPKSTLHPRLPLYFP